MTNIQRQLSVVAALFSIVVSMENAHSQSLVEQLSRSPASAYALGKASLRYELESRLREQFGNASLTIFYRFDNEKQKQLLTFYINVREQKSASKDDCEKIIVSVKQSLGWDHKENASPFKDAGVNHSRIFSYFSDSLTSDDEKRYNRDNAANDIDSISYFKVGVFAAFGAKTQPVITHCFSMLRDRAITFTSY